MYFRQVFEPRLAQYAYIIGCQRTGEAIVFDPQRDIQRYIDIASKEGLKITAVAETHIHADFLSGARAFADAHNVALYLSDEGDEDWKYTWAKQAGYNFHPLKHGDMFRIGNIGFQVLHTPGHTPEHICFLVTDFGGGADEPMGIVSGDFVFVGDLGRPDLLETAAGVQGAQDASAARLYDSVKQFLTLQDHLQIWPGHGAGSACGKALGAVPMSTVGYEKQFNAAIQFAHEGRAPFVNAILDGQPEPPLYFGRMKRENKEGPAVLPAIPIPRQIPIATLMDAAAADDTAILDLRTNRSAFMQQHVPKALFAPLNNSFPTVAGSYIRPNEAVYLVVKSSADVREAVDNLVRIGIDNIAGYTLAQELASASNLSQIREIAITDLDISGRANNAVLDVRRKAEFDEGHIPEAINIAHTRLLDRLDELSEDTTYFVHCKSGGRAALASAMLKRAGHDVVYVNGLYAEWAKHNREEADQSLAA
ncbi:MAG: MBL fold metallo-hydrolase [Bacteroidota bacterium]